MAVGGRATPLGRAIAELGRITGSEVRNSDTGYWVALIHGCGSLDLIDVRTRILKATADLLAVSPVGDVATRAVCEAAGVAPTALYRQFGDKEGLLAAVVDYGYESYLATKRALAETDDPVADLRTGWDNHVTFALENPALYRLMWTPGLTQPAGAMAEAHQLLRAVLERCAAAGLLRVDPQTGQQMVMSANVGVCLSLVARPALYPDPAVAGRVRDALYAAILTPARTAVASAAGEQTATNAAAAQLAALLARSPSSVFTGSESQLLHEWLRRLADAQPKHGPRADDDRGSGSPSALTAQPARRRATTGSTSPARATQ